MELFVNGIQIHERVDGKTDRELEEQIWMTHDCLEDVEGRPPRSSGLCDGSIRGELVSSVGQAVVSAADDARSGNNVDVVLGLVVAGLHVAVTILVDVICGALLSVICVPVVVHGGDGVDVEGRRVRKLSDKEVDDGYLLTESPVCINFDVMFCYCY